MTFRLTGKQRHARNNQDRFLWWAHHKCIGSSLFSREKLAVWISLFWLPCFHLKTCWVGAPHCWDELRLSRLSGAGIPAGRTWKKRQLFKVWLPRTQPYNTLHPFNVITSISSLHSLVLCLLFCSFLKLMTLGVTFINLAHLHTTSPVTIALL